MNQIYNTICNKNSGCLKQVSEQNNEYVPSSNHNQMAQTQVPTPLLGAIASLSVLGLTFLSASTAAAVNDVQLPTGAKVTVGQATVQSVKNVLSIEQSTQNVGINWDTFNIGEKATVNFYQPNSSSIAVNRVLDNNASQIMGKLNANGQVFLLNPNGVIFSKTAQLNIGGIVASTLNITDGDILSGNFTLKNQGGKGKIENHGSIIANGGTIAFIAPTVVNTGELNAENGVVHLTAADQVTLRLQDGQLTEYQVDIGTVQALIDNQGAVLANNGAVYLTAKAKDQLSKAVVNHSGVIEANRVSKNAKGEVVLLADMQTGKTIVSGEINAKGLNGQDGGFIETSAAHVQIENEAQVSTKSTEAQTGTWLIDPTDFTITGGTASKSNSSIGAKTLENNLQNTSVILETIATGNQAGDIHVNANVTWNAATKLTLKAHNDIYVNADITAQHNNGQVALVYGQNNNNTANYHLADSAKINLKAGQNFSTQKGTDISQKINYTVITELGLDGSESGRDLQGINGNLAGNYVLGADINASQTAYWGIANEKGFNPIGNEWSDGFRGRFDGLGHHVSNLTIDRPYDFGVGLFGNISDATIRNLGVTGGEIQGDIYVGGLVGQSNNSLIENSYSQANVQGNGTIGGLVGGNFDGVIKDSYATGEVTGDADYSSYVGGLVGGNDNSHIENSYTTGNVSGYEAIGGLVGDNNQKSTIVRSYATGNVKGNEFVGGLAGQSQYGSEILDSYATGSVTGQALVGGLVGENLAADIEHAYATGKVTADSKAGGLVGTNTQGTVSQSVWNKETTGQDTSSGSQNSSALTTEQMFDAKNYTGFDFENTWDNASNQTTAYLKNHKGQNNVQLKNDTSGESYSVIQNIDQLQAILHNLNGRYLLGNNIDASVTQTWSHVDGQGFTAIGSQNAAFTGILNGLDHDVQNLYIDQQQKDQIGLIGVNVGTVKKLAVVNAQITAKNDVGAVIGLNKGIAEHIYSSGSVTGENQVGGLIGQNTQNMKEVYSQANVTGQANVGGLIGQNTANVQDVYTTGQIIGDANVGGIIGANTATATVKNAIVHGQVSSTHVNANSVANIIGQNEGHLTAAYWNKDIQTAVKATGNDRFGTDVVGLSTEDIKKQESFIFLDENSKLGGEETVWRIYEGKTGPFLRHYLQTVDLNLRDKRATYTGQEQSLNQVLNLDNSKFVAEGQTKATNAGEYQAQYYSNDQQGYDFIGETGTLIIDKAKVIVQGSSDTNNIYNGQIQSMDNPSYTIEGLVNEESATLLGVMTASGASGKDAGTYKNQISGQNNETDNYTIEYKDGNFVIHKKNLTITAANETREYNGDFQQINSFIADGLVEGETEDTIRSAINAIATRKDAGEWLHAVGFTNNPNSAKNYNITFKNGTYTITKATATVTAHSQQTTYNGQTQTLGGFGVSGLKGNDQQSMLGLITNTAASGRNVGTYDNIVSGNVSSTNYNIVYENGRLTIIPKEITAVISAQNKVYDGTSNAVVSAILNNVIQGDDVRLDVTGQFIDKNAGQAKAVNVTGNRSGTDAENYQILNVLDTTADIEKAKLQVRGNSLITDYTGQPYSVSGFTADGLVGGETSDVLTNIVASGATGSSVGTYYNQVSGSDRNYDLVFTAGMLKINDVSVIPTEPVNPTEPVIPTEPVNPKINLYDYQRAIQFAPTPKTPKKQRELPIEIVGDGINMDGIETLMGSFK